MKFLFQKRESFGLDISDLSLKIAKLKKKKREITLTSFGEEAIPQGIVEKGEIKDTKGLSEIIRKALQDVKGEKIKTCYVICSLPEEKSFLDIIQLPPLKNLQEVKTAVRYEIENYIPLSAEEVYFDCQIIKSISDHPSFTEVLLAAAPKTLVESYVETLKMAGLEPVALEIECLSIARALIKKEQTKKPLLIIDFGETRTTFIIFSGMSVRFTSTIPVSSQKITEAIAKTLKIDIKKAEKLKRTYGLQGNKEVFEAMIPSLTDLVEQIKLHIDYYHSHEKRSNHRVKDGKDLEKVLLCGGGANLKGLISFLSSQLKVQVTLGNPWVNIFEEPLSQVPPLSFEKSLGYSTALGLALRGIQQEDFFNF